MKLTKSQEDQSLVSIIVSAAIDRLAPRKTQKELAREMGFLRPGMLSMIKTGTARIPFTKLPNVAAALGIDPALLIRAHLCETWPEFENVAHEVFGGVLTETEREWIEFFEGMGMLAPPAEAEKREKLQKMLLAHDWEDEDDA
jgi:transcriptional regulator with XRE-family HTH domain